MDVIHLTLLALVQGLTEFLPISSSAHLILPSQVLGWDDQGLAFDVAVHVGSLLAVVIYFRKEVIALIFAWFRSLKGHHCTESRLAWLVILATLPAAFAGLLFHDFIETYLRSTLVIAITTIVFGVLLGIADKFGRQTVAMGRLTLWQALAIGVSQALALIPGTSRSGVTMTSGLLLGLERQAAARFSFLLSIPLIAMSGGYKALGLMEAGSVVWNHLFLGIAVAAVSAGACIHLFLKWIDRIGMMPFVIYRLFLGGVLLMFYFTSQ